jgi:hypothetical protein
MKVYIVLFIMLIACPAALPQTLMMQDFAKERTTIGIRYMRPDYESFTVTPFSGIYDFRLNIPVSRKLDIVTSLPLVSFNRKSSKTYFYGNDGNALGNWFLGIQSRPSFEQKSYSSFIFGIYIPTSSDKDYWPLGFALSSHFHEKYKYQPHTLTIYGNYARRYFFDEGISLAWEAGPQIYIPTKESANDGQLYAHYGVSASIESQNFFGTAEIVGTVDLTHKYEYFDYRFMHFIALGAGFSGPVVTPVIYYQIPVDKKDWYGLPNSIFGIKLSFQMR